jgi:hypothetical protein
LISSQHPLFHNPVASYNVVTVAKAVTKLETLMPLDEREQRILQEIERRFYEEDPDLAHTVRSIQRSAGSKTTFYLAIAGLVVGVGLTLATFAFNQWLALAGFVMMVASGTALVQVLRRRAGKAPIGLFATSAMGEWLNRFKGRGRFRR